MVREREIGTLEQIMVTPIGQVEFILGKTIPFFLIGLFDAVADHGGGHVLVSRAAARKPASVAGGNGAVICCACLALGC